MLSAYSAAVENARRETSLHVCVTCCHGDLEEGDVWEVEHKCQLLGTTAILFVLDVSEEALSDQVSLFIRLQEFESLVLQFIPLIYIYICLVTLISFEDVCKNLDLRKLDNFCWFVSSGLVVD